jgi:hypothetical protein
MQSLPTSRRIPSALRSRRPARALAALLCTAALSFTQASVAQTWVPFYEDGKKLAEQGKWTEACPKFAEAHRQKPDAVGITLNLADCYKHTGKTASAWSLFKEGSFRAKSNDKDEARAAYADKEAAALEPTLSRLQVDVEDTPGLTIHIDEQDLGKGAFGSAVPVDPGDHKVEATAPGYSVWSTSVRIGPNKDMQHVKIPGLQKVATPLTPGAATPPNPALRPAAFAVGGVGAAGLLVGGVMGGLALGDKSSLSTACKNGACLDQASKDKLASAKTKALVSTIGLSAGGAALATGVVLFVLSTRGSAATKDERKPALVPALAPGFAGLTAVGAF